MGTPRNPFELIISPEPDATKSGSNPHHAEVTIPAGGFIPAHFHIPGPDGQYDHAHAEIYHWLSGGTLRVILRRSHDVPWRMISLNATYPTIAILGGWHHGAVVSGKSGVVFRAISRTDHFRSVENGGNVHRLPDEEQPVEIRAIMRVARLREVSGR